MVIFIQIIDSIRFFGLVSIVISTPTSFFGFLLYGLTPIAFYATGINLFISRPWARTSGQIILPAVSLLIVMHLAVHSARIHAADYRLGLLDLLNLESGIFAQFLLRYSLVFLPVVFYLGRQNVVEYFKESSPAAPDL